MYMSTSEMDEIREEVRNRIEEAAEESGKDKEKVEELMKREDWMNNWCPAIPFKGDMEPVCNKFDELKRLVQEEGLDMDEAISEAFSEEDSSESAEQSEQSTLEETEA